tara:strand:+ start:313 stop:483 length:171 start_codon:yes stop_codon:yes gene_type:complete
MKENKLIELWLQAEDENRKGKNISSLKLKEKFNKNLKTISKSKQAHIIQYLESCGA